MNVFCSGSQIKNEKAQGELRKISRVGKFIVLEYGRLNKRNKFTFSKNKEFFSKNIRKQNTDFLGNRSRGFRPPPQEPIEILMNALGLQRMQAPGQSRRGNQRRF